MNTANTVTAVVGCGGTGGWLCQLLGKTPKQYPSILLIDGDRVEKKNLDRQLFSRRDVNRNKAEIICARMFREDTDQHTDVIPEYLKLNRGWPYNALLNEPRPLALFCCPDNHAARNACLVTADRRDQFERETIVIVTGNESTTGSADLYVPEWANSPLDPRVRYPEIRTSLEGDPLSPTHCTGDEALEQDPQLALYNGLTAFAALWLLESWHHTWSFRNSELFSDILKRTPVSVNITPNEMKTIKYKDLYV